MSTCLLHRCTCSIHMSTGRHLQRSQSLLLVVGKLQKLPQMQLLDLCRSLAYGHHKVAASMVLVFLPAKGIPSCRILPKHAESAPS